MPVQYTKKGETRVYNAISELKEMIAGALVWLPRFFIESNARNRFVQKRMGMNKTTYVGNYANQGLQVEWKLADDTWAI